MTTLQCRESVLYGDGKTVPLHIESLHAFISAAAGELKVDDSVVEAVIKTLFNIDHVNKLPSQEFKSAVRFLVGLHGNASKISVFKKRYEYGRRYRNHGF